MATRHVLKNCKVYSGAYDLSGASNSLTTEYAFDEVPANGYGDACAYSLPGLATFTFSLEGFAAADGSTESDDILAGRLGTENVPMTFCPTTGAAGETGYFTKTIETSYSVGGAVGDMYKFTASGSGQNVNLVRGTMLENGAKTSTAAGTARLIGAASATQSLYCIMHVLAVSGTNPTLDVIIESDSAANFPHTATAATFAQATTIGSQALASVAGPITDTYYRASWTIGGTNTPSFTVVICVGIV